MAITNFIPTIWSENLYRSLDRQYIAAANSNREFEGEIKNCGSVVKICGVGAVTVNDYTKNIDMSTPQELSDTVTELRIDQAKYFNFQIDDVDKAQATPKLMDAAMNVAANALANEADKYILSICEETNQMVSSNDPIDASNILDYILKAREMLYNSGVSDSTEVVLEVSPAIASVILKAKIDLASNNNDAVENGYLGSIGGCKIYVSHNIKTTPITGGKLNHICIMRTKRAVAFAEQLSEIEAYRPEKRFADAVKGLHLYGARAIYLNEIVLLNLNTSI